jgi:predicted RNA-binding Zn ribbon-like protein
MDLVVDFLNTVDHESGTDVTADPDAWPRWLAERELTGSDTGSGTDVRAVRTALRAAVGDRHDPPAEVSVPVTVELPAGGAPRFAATDVVGAVLAAAGRLAVLGQWPRVKVCAADDCRWAFYDRSRNRSRTWCSMQVCGNREKARTWRRSATR